MFVLTIDQRASRTSADLVPELLARLSATPAVLDFERTVGDEVQGVLDDPSAVLALTLEVLDTRRWSVGIGAGAVDRPLAASTRASTGAAFLAARDAVEAAKHRRAGTPLAVRGSAPADADAQALVTLLATIRRRRSAKGWQAVRCLAETGSQTAAAARLGVSQQTVSQRLRAALWAEEQAAQPAAVRLLAAADR